MDSHFLEFWGNFFLSAARGQKRMEDAARWMSQGFRASGFSDLADMFERAYGIEKDAEGGTTPDPGGWAAAVRQFNRSFREYMALMGMVPTEEHRRLQEKCDALEKKCAGQEETITHLRKLIGADKAGHEEVVQKFQAMLEQQSARFQDLVLSSARFLESAATPSKPPGEKS